MTDLLLRSPGPISSAHKLLHGIVLEGYASIFDRLDMSGDIVRAGAFRQAIVSRMAGGVRMLFQHDPMRPVGVWNEIREDTKGLFVRGILLPDVQQARELACLLRAGAINGLSIGFKTKRAHRDRKTGRRHLFEVDLWEVSLVTFPMLPEARVHTLKMSAEPVCTPDIPSGKASAGGSELSGPGPSARKRIHSSLCRAARHIHPHLL